MQDLGHHQRGKRCFLSRFQHQRTPARQGGADAPQLGDHRPVPRNDRAHHTHWRLVRIGHEIAGDGIVENVPLGVHRLRCVVAEGLLNPATKQAGAGQRRPHVDRFQPGQFLEPGIDRLSCFEHQRLPVKRAPARPFAFEGGPGGGDRTVNILRSAARYLDS